MRVNPDAPEGISPARMIHDFHAELHRLGRMRADRETARDFRSPAKASLDRALMRQQKNTIRRNIWRTVFAVL